MALFFSQSDLVHRECQMQIKKADNYVTALNNNDFLIYHSTPVSATEICLENGVTKSKTFQLDVLEKIHVHDACFIQLPDARLYSISQIESDSKIEVYRWAVDFKDLIPGLNPNDINALVKSFQNTTNALVPVDPVLYKALHRDLQAAAEPHYVTEWPFQAALGIGGTALLLGGVLFTIVCVAGLYKRRRAAAEAANVVANNQQLRMQFLDNAMRDPLLLSAARDRHRSADAMPPSAPRLVP